MNGVLIGITYLSQAYISNSSIISNISIGSGSYGVAVVVGLADNTNLTISNLSASMTVTQSNSNFSAIAGYIYSGYYLFYNISSFQVTPSLPCIMNKVGSVNSTSSKVNTSCT